MELRAQPFSSSLVRREQPNNLNGYYNQFQVNILILDCDIRVEEIKCLRESREGLCLAEITSVG